MSYPWILPSRSTFKYRLLCESINFFCCFRHHHHHHLNIVHDSLCKLIQNPQIVNQRIIYSNFCSSQKEIYFFLLLVMTKAHTLILEGTPARNMSGENQAWKKFFSFCCVSVIIINIPENKTAKNFSLLHWRWDEWGVRERKISKE